MKTFEEHVRDGSNNSLDCLEALFREHPKWGKMMIATGTNESQAGLREDVQKVLTTTTKVKTAQERLQDTISNLKRNGGKLDIEIKHPNDLTEYQMEAVKAAQELRLNPRPVDAGLQFDDAGKLVNPFLPQPRKLKGETMFRHQAIAMELEIR